MFLKLCAIVNEKLKPFFTNLTYGQASPVKRKEIDPAIIFPTLEKTVSFFSRCFVGILRESLHEMELMSA